LNTCRVYGYIVDPSGNPLEGVVVSAIPSESPSIVTGTDYAISPISFETVTTSTGYFYMDLLQGAKFVINIQSIGYKQVISVPTEASATLWSLSAVPNTGPGSGGGGTDW
jgi:hypothetical protein